MPVVVEGLADELSGEIFVLLAAALVVMALVLALVFGPPLRLLPLALALVAARSPSALLALFGGSLTMASIAVLPVLIGLAVDYAIQFQARFNEARDAGLVAAARPPSRRRPRGGPVIGDRGAGHRGRLPRPAALADPDGPRVRAPAGAGIAIAFVLALTAGLAVLSLTGRSQAAARPAADRRFATVGSRERRLFDRVGRGEAPRVALRRRRAGMGRRALAVSIATPGRVLAVGAVARGRRLGRRHPDRGDLRHPRARARATCPSFRTSTSSRRRPASPARST